MGNPNRGINIVIATHGFSESYFKVGSFFLAKYLSKKGHKVLSVTFPISFFHLISQLFKRTNTDELFRKLAASFKTIIVTAGGFKEFVPFTIIPFKLTFPFRYFANQQNQIPLLRRSLRKNGFLNVDVLIIENPTLSWLTKVVSYRSLIYRITDIYFEMDFKGSQFEELEASLLKKSNLVIVTSVGIQDFIRRKYRYDQQIVVMENGVDVESFLGSFHSKQQKSIKFQHTNNAVYVGALDNRLDYDMIDKVARQIPDMGFYFYGPKYSIKTSRFSSNVFFKGPIPYNELGFVLANFDFGLLPFTDSPANHGRSPMKLYEYGICGLPTVAKRTRDLDKKSQQDKFILLYDTPQEFIKCVSTAIDSKKELGAIAYKSAQKKSWSYKVENLEKLISQKHAFNEKIY